MKKILMNPRGLWIMAAVLAIGMIGCKKDTTVPTVPVLNIWSGGEIVNTLTIQSLRAGDTHTFGVSGSRDWIITKPTAATWVSVSPSSGSQSDTPVTVTVTVAANGGEIRSTTLTISARDGSVSKTVTVSQEGDLPDVDNMAIADFRDTYLSDIASSTTVDNSNNPYIELPEAVVFMGTVVSDNAGGNIETYLFALQDANTPNSGVIINLNDHGANLGDIVVATCNAGRQAKLFNNLLQVQATNIQVYGAGTIPDPIVVNSSNIRTYESQLIRINDIQSQSDAAGQTWNGTSGSNIFVNEAGETYTSYVKSGAAFANSALSTGNGYLIGLSGVFGATTQIQPRNAADTQFLTGERFEIIEPEDGTNILFRENMGTTNVSGSTTTVDSFTGWTRFGVGAENVTYSTATGQTGEATVRSTTPSSGYTVASGGNNVFFGNLAGEKIFLVSGIQTFGITDLMLGFGLNNTSEGFVVEWSSDGGTQWNNISFEKVSDVWGYTVIPFTVGSSVTEISLRFRTSVDSTYRLDDVTVSTNSEAPSYFTVSETAIDVPAAGGNATVDVNANVAWTAAVTDGAANITSGPTPTGGNGNQTITLVFPENTDTENTKTVTLRVSTTATVTPNFYDVVFTQESAIPATTSVETFSTFTSTNNSYTAAAASGTYTSVDVPGLIWTYAGTAHNQAGAKFVIGRYSGSNTNPGSLTTNTITTGVGSISIDWIVPFNDANTGISFKVFVNDTERGTFTLAPASTSVGTTGTYTIDDINISGNAVIQIASNETGRPGVNRVQWTAY